MMDYEDRSTSTQLILLIEIQYPNILFMIKQMSYYLYEITIIHIFFSLKIIYIMLQVFYLNVIKANQNDSYIKNDNLKGLSQKQEKYNFIEKSSKTIMGPT